MVILVLSDLWVPFPGGAERLMFNLARHLHRAGEDVRVITGYRGFRRLDGPRIFNVIEVPENIVGAIELSREIDGMRPDVILTHHYWALTFSDEFERAPCPVVQVVLNGRRLPFAAMAVYISEYVRTMLGDSQSQDMTILPPAFDDVRAETHDNAIGFIKPLHHKGVDLVYDIARAMPDRQFIVLRGEWQDIETIVDLPNVEYMEPVVDIRDFYERVNIVLMPSLSEDAGTVAQECAINGIPCISSDAGGLVETNYGGVIIDTRDVERWVDEIALLDDRDHYASVVIGMKRWRPPQRDLLDEFVARMRALQR